MKVEMSQPVALQTSRRRYDRIFLVKWLFLIPQKVELSSEEVAGSYKADEYNRLVSQHLEVIIEGGHLSVLTFKEPYLILSRPISAEKN